MIALVFFSTFLTGLMTEAGFEDLVGDAYFLIEEGLK